MLSKITTRVFTAHLGRMYPTSQARVNHIQSLIQISVFRNAPTRCFTRYNRAYVGYHGLLLKPKPTTNLKASLSSQTDDVKEVVVPQMAESLSEGDIKWDKAIGDSVSEDEVIGAVETDKTSIPIHSPAAGVIVEFLVEDGATVNPGQKILKLKVGASSSGPPGQASVSKPVPEATSQETQKPQKVEPHKAAESVNHAPSSTVSTTAVKTDIDSVRQPISSADVKPVSFGARTVSQVKMNRMRQKIASRLKEAQNTYALLTTFNEIDMSNLIDLRQRYKDAFVKKHNAKLGFMSAFVKASAYALQDQPVVNAVIEDNKILYRDFIDISVAVASPKGLVVPVLRNVETMNYADIEKAIANLGEKARNNTLSVDEMEGGTFTISNGGVFGSLFGTPIVNPPQSAILGMHSINEKPAAVNGKVEIRPIMIVALTYDHRLIDGREAVTFLKKIKEVVEDPRIMLLDL